MTLDGSNSDVLAAAALLRSHPRFWSSLQLFAELYPAAFENNFIFSRIATEEIRQIIGIYMWNRHFLRDVDVPRSGLTISAVQDFCSARGLAGPKRVAALMMLMRHGGFIAPAFDDRDLRVKRVEPTPKAMAVTRDLFSAFLRPLSLLTGDQGYLNRLAANNDLLRDIFGAGLDFYLRHGFLSDAIPELQFCTSRNAGFEMMLKLVAAPAKGDTTDARIVSFPYADISKSLTVSRVHVSRFVEDAEHAGHLVVLEPGGRAIALRPSLFDLAERSVALSLAWVWLGTGVNKNQQG